MTRDDDFEVRPGRIRQSRGRTGSALHQVLGAAQRAGGLGRRLDVRGSVFGRGRASGVRALHRLGASGRSVVVKARVVRHRVGGAPLSAHLRYIQREGVTQEGSLGRLFDGDNERADVRGFGRRCDGDRHHFRFIVAPEDAIQLEDLKAFTRDLMKAAEADLDTRLDWVAVDHWNTGHPHVHVLVRGVADDGRDLVISRDYIGQGLRARACELVSLELGPRTERDIRHALARDIGSDRWTRLDGLLVREAARDGGRLDLRPGPDRAAPLRLVKIARIEALQGLGLAEPIGVGRWRLSPEAEPTLKAIGRRSDIIARIHDGLVEAGLDRPAEQIVAHEGASAPVIGRVLAQGLDDELKGTGYLVIDGLDGRLHHHPVRDLTEVDVRLGAVVEVAPVKGGPNDGRMAVFVRSDLAIERQVSADGATWLDRQLMRTNRAGSQTGFGQAVETALEQRIDHLEREGLARRDGTKVRFAPNLLQTLCDRELSATGRRLAAETGLVHRVPTEDDTVSGVYRRRLALASGRFAMIDDGLGFTLVPWRPALDRRLGQSVSGVVGPGSSIDWSVGRSRGPSR